MPDVALSSSAEDLAPWIRSSLSEAMEVLRRRGFHDTADSLYRLSEIVNAAHLDTFRNADTEEILEDIYCAVYDEDIDGILSRTCATFGVGHCAVAQFLHDAGEIRCESLVSTWNLRWAVEYVKDGHYIEDPYVKNAIKYACFILDSEAAVGLEAEERMLQCAEAHGIGRYGVSFYVETGENQFSVVSMRSCDKGMGGRTHLGAYMDDLLCIATNLALALVRIARMQKQWRK